ncbi:MAG TPA: hypothetical protein VGM53_07215 [Streptosporangiaceae bacterium]|jgi:hypothetical protein
MTQTAPAASAALGLPAQGGLAALRDTPVWSDAAVAGAGLRIQDVPFVTIGGGLASFALVGFLRNCRVPAAEIRVVSPQPRPYENLHHLMRRSQILETDPLRSDSMSRVDNVWGFPSYAAERSMAQRSLRPMWNVLAEPVATEFFNPTGSEVFRGIDREAVRVGWPSMLLAGRGLLVRKREDGGYFCLVCPVAGSAAVALRSQYVHLGTGYPAVNYPREVSGYRMRHHDYFRVVNAYEPHEHVYQVLRRRAGTVVIRGAGVTASRVLERLFDDREKSGCDVQILHLIRNYVEGPQGPPMFRRPGGHGWSYQPFSFPKAAGAGQLRQRMLGMDNLKRAEYIASISGTTSAKRRIWQRQLERGRAGGYYRAYRGDIRGMTPSGRGTVDLRIDVDALPGDSRIEADFVLDCTGLKLALRENPLLCDLLDTGTITQNPMGGLDVGQHFEVRGAERSPGQMYASGVIARGGYLAPVDSFWGFSHAGLLICDDLARRGFCGRLGVTRSVTGWLKWLRHRTP